MKSVMITFDQAHEEDVLKALTSSVCRGFTLLPQAYGRGSKTGEPHMGSHAWPSMNEAVITICEDSRVDGLLERLRAIDEENPLLGLRAFVWNIEQTL